MILLSRFVISGHSMEPSILSGQTVFVSNLPYLLKKPKIGDIVVFKKENKIFIKRIAKINPPAGGEKYFLMGDNKNDTMDSRKFGWIEKKKIIGKVILKI